MASVFQRTRLIQFWIQPSTFDRALKSNCEYDVPKNLNSFTHVQAAYFKVSESGWDWWFNVTCNDISVIYLTAHLNVRRTEEEVVPTVALPNAIDISGRARPSTATRPPFKRLFRETAQFSRLLRHAGDTEDLFSSWTPGSPRGHI